MNTLRKILIGATSAAAVAGLASAAAAQTLAANQANLPVKVKIIQEASIASSGTLDFGTVVAGTAGAIVIKADGTRDTSATDADIIPTSTVAAGSFTVSGEANTPFTVDLSVGTMSASGVTLGSLTHTNGCGASLTNASFSTGSSCTFGVGGTLSLTAAAQPNANVTGNITATVNYN